MSAAREVRDALAIVCADCAAAAFLRGPGGVIIGGSSTAARRWIHDSIAALLVARRARARLRRTTATTRALDVEIATAETRIEDVMHDLDDLVDLLVEVGVDADAAQVIQ